jgi:hypothetical protein
MKKVLALLLVTAIIVGAVPYARSLGVPPSPPGVSANDWIPLGDAAGFVITHNNAPLSSPTKPGAVKGYFMVRLSNSWLRRFGTGITTVPCNFDSLEIAARASSLGQAVALCTFELQT